MISAVSKGKVKKQKISSYKKAQRNIALIFLLPNFLGFVVFIVYPVLKSLYISFFNWDGLGTKEFIGLNNYISLLSDSTFKVSFWNNIHYTVVTVPLSIILGILIAMLMNVKLKGIQVFRVI